jgi:hypothetical protein
MHKIINCSPLRPIENVIDYLFELNFDSDHNCRLNHCTKVMIISRDHFFTNLHTEYRLSHVVTLSLCVSAGKSVHSHVILK